MKVVSHSRLRVQFLAFSVPDEEMKEVTSSTGLLGLDNIRSKQDLDGKASIRLDKIR